MADYAFHVNVPVNALRQNPNAMVFCVDPVHPTIRWEFRLNNQRYITLRPYSTDGNVPNWFCIASIVDGGRPFDHLHPDYNPRTIKQLLPGDAEYAIEIYVDEIIFHAVPTHVAQ